MRNQLLDLSFHIRQKDKKIREITNQTRKEVRNESNPSKSHKANLQKLMNLIYSLPKEEQQEYSNLKSLLKDSPRPKENIPKLEKARNLSVNSAPVRGASDIPYKKYIESDEYLYSLYISDAKSASDYVELQKYNIQAVLTFGKNNDPSKFTVLKGGYLCIPIEDQSKDLIQNIERITKFIDLHLVKGNILIHCCQGNSISCAALMGYLIKRFKVSFEKSLNIVQEGRPSLYLTKSLERQLCRIERAELYN